MSLDLFKKQQAAKAELDKAKRAVSEVAEEIATAYSEKVKAAYNALQKQGGSQSVPLQDGLVAKGDISKEVKWNQDLMRMAAASMTFVEVMHYFKIEFSMTEVTYKSLPNGAFKDLIDEARSVKYGELKITLVEK